MRRLEIAGQVLVVALCAVSCIVAGAQLPGAVVGAHMAAEAAFAGR